MTGSTWRKNAAAETAAKAIRFARKPTWCRNSHDQPRMGGELIQSVDTAMLRLAIAHITAIMRTVLPGEGRNRPRPRITSRIISPAMQAPIPANIPAAGSSMGHSLQRRSARDARDAECLPGPVCYSVLQCLCSLYSARVPRSTGVRAGKAYLAPPLGPYRRAVGLLGDEDATDAAIVAKVHDNLHQARRARVAVRFRVQLIRVPDGNDGQRRNRVLFAQRLLQ